MFKAFCILFILLHIIISQTNQKEYDLIVHRPYLSIRIEMKILNPQRLIWIIFIIFKLKYSYFVFEYIWYSLHSNYHSFQYLSHLDMKITAQSVVLSKLLLEIFISFDRLIIINLLNSPI